MKAREIHEEIELLRFTARELRKNADALDKRADELRELAARENTEELNFGLKTS